MADKYRHLRPPETQVQALSLEPDRTNARVRGGRRRSRQSFDLTGTYEAVRSSGMGSTEITTTSSSADELNSLALEGRRLRRRKLERGV